MSEQSISEQALAIADPAERAAFLDQVCGTNLELRQRVEELLNAPPARDSREPSAYPPTTHILAKPVHDPNVTTDLAPDSPPPTHHANAGNGSLDRTTAHLAPLEMVTAPGLPMIPGYEIVSELGRGGMGVVYEARQTGLNRTVALKMILGEGSANPKAVIRFLAEAEAVAAIRHPHVVEVYQFGEHAGRPFMALEFCPGGSLADKLKPGGMKPQNAARIMEAVAEGVGAAHAAGIVHRDLKPHNVLLQENGSPKVTDFGLAKRAVSDAHLTKTNAIMGTPAYMAPEQAQGGTKFVGPAADVWALGVMLYEMVSGKRPFRGDDTWEVLAAVMKGEVVPLRKVLPDVPHDLELICEKCLSKEPRDRYPDAAELAADLHRFVAGEPVSVRPLGSVERLTRWVRRNKVLTAAMTAAAVAMIAGTAVSLWQADLARTAAKRADEEAQKAGDERDAAKYEAFRAEDARNAIQLQFAYSNFEKQDYQAASLGLGDPSKLPEAVRNRWENGLLRGALNRAYEPVCQHHTPDDDPNDLMQLFNMFGKSEERGPVWNWCLSVDGTWLAVDSPQQLFAMPGKVTFGGIKEKKQPTEIRIWDMRTRQSVAEIPAKDKAICGLAFDPDAAFLAAACVHSVIIWDARSGRLKHDVPAPKGGTFISVCFSADGKRLFCGGYDGSVRVIDAATGKITQTFPIQEMRKGEPLRVRCLKLTPDGKSLVGGLGRTNKDKSTVGRVVIWDAATGEQKPKLAFPDAQAQVVSMDISRDGKWLATMGQTGEKAKPSARDIVQVWDLSSGESRPGWSVPVEANSGPSETNNTNGAFRMMMDMQIEVGGESAELSQVARGDILQVCFNLAGNQLTTTGRDGVLRTWARDGSAVASYRPPGEYFWQLAWLPDGKMLLGDSHGLVSRFDPVARLHSRAFPSIDAAEVTVESLSLNADETRLVASTYLNPKGPRDAFAGRHRRFTFQTLSLTDGRRIGNPVTLTEQCMNAYSDGTRTVVAGEWLVTEVRDAGGKRQIYAPAGEGKAGHVSDMARFAFSADNTRLVGVIRDFIGIKAYDWNPSTGEKRSEMEVPDSLPVKEFASGVSPNGRLVAVYLHIETPTVLVLDLESKETRRRLESLAGLQGAVRPTSIAVTDDGGTVFLGDANGKVHVWNLETEQEKLIFQAHAGRVTAMILSPDGHRLYTAGGGTIAVWDDASRGKGP